jgi:hypothetical protein
MPGTNVHILTDLKIGEPRVALNLTVVPLSGNPAAALPYLLIDEALEKKEVLIEEISEGGSVPELRLTSFSDRTVLIVDGTELVGAKQNRIVNASILIPPKSVTKIPVSCVEQGRWRYRTREFQGSRFHAAHRLRKISVEHQKVSLKEKRGYASDQGMIWAAVGDIASKVGAHSPTGAMNDLYEQKEKTIDGYLGKIALEGWETGAAFFIGRKLESLELFDRAATFTGLFRKLLSGVAVEAITGGSEGKNPAPGNAKTAVRSLLKEIGLAMFEKHQTPVGVGEDWRYDGQQSFGKTLYFNGDLIHLSAFRK